MSIALPASLTLAQASGVLTELRQAVRQAPREGIVIDAGALEQLDSSCIAVLLQCRRDALARAVPLRVLNPPAKLAALLKLYGVDSLFEAPAEVAAA